MAMQINKFSTKEVEVTPFGIDTDLFRQIEIERIFNKDEIVIGTIKTLEEKYGLEYLIRAFRIVKNNMPNFQLKLLIVGGGSLEERLKNLTKELGLTNDSIFTGYINYQGYCKIS